MPLDFSFFADDMILEILGYLPALDIVRYRRVGVETAVVSTANARSWPGLPTHLPGIQGAQCLD